MRVAQYSVNLNGITKEEDKRFSIKFCKLHARVSIQMRRKSLAYKTKPSDHTLSIQNRAI